MTESLANRISRYFVICGIAKEDDREVLAFILFQIFALVQQIIILTTVAVILNSFPQTIAFIFFFASIKRYAGGAHANKHLTCLIVSTVLTVSVSRFCKMVVLPSYIAIIASVVTLALVLIRAPVIHPNNPKPQRVQKKMRKISVIIAVLQCLLILLSSAFLPVIALPGALGGLSAAATLLLPIPKNET